MNKLMKYLKPFSGLIIAVFILLFVQAMCDLALPDYTSNIVNKGIQQGGIASAVPKVLRQSEMNKLKLFMSDEGTTEVLKNYILIDKSNKDYLKYLKEYPILSSKSIYVLNKTDKAEIDKLNPVMGKAFLCISKVERLKGTAKDGFISIDGRKISANADLFAMLGKMPKGKLVKIREEIMTKFSSMDISMIIQSAVPEIKDEYKALGLSTDEIQNKYIKNIGAVMLLISLLSGTLTVLVSFLSAKTASGFAKDIRKRIFKKVEDFSSTEFDKFSTSSLITRCTNDITQVQMLIVITMKMVFYAPIIGAGGVIRAFNKSVSMSWIIALTVIILLGFLCLIFSIAMPKFKTIQKLVDRLNLVTRENLSGIMAIRAFNAQKFEENRFDTANKDLTETNLFVNRVTVSMTPAMTLIMNGIMLLIVWAGAREIADSKMQVGDMMAFMQYAMQIISAFIMLSIVFIMFPRASVSAGRIAEVLDTDECISDPKNPEHFCEDEKGIVEFKNVSFRYPGAEEDAVKNISFKALPGETTAFIGATGSGKSTLINLIPRFYDASEGEILIDGVNIKNVPQHELRNRIGYVPQKSSLFSGTIESNLKYADENASDEDIKKAVQIAQASEFISEKTEGFEAEIAQGGDNVSGGQKQRLSIARAIVKKPEIYIFDDSFSALDFKTDAALRHALKKEIKSSTFIIVAQRISTIKNADKIIVLENGNIVGMGIHSELMKNCRTYREIALSQLSKEELA